MTKRYLCMVFILFATFLIISACSPIQNEREEPYPVVIENTVNSTLDDWKQIEGIWVMENDQTAPGNSERQVAFFSEPLHLSFSFDAEILLDGGEGGLVFFAEENDNGSFNGYYFGLDVLAGKAVFYWMFNGREQLLADKNITLAEGMWYTVRVEAHQGHITCYVLNNPNDLDPFPVFDISHKAHEHGRGGFLAKGDVSYKVLSISEYMPPILTEYYINSLVENCADPYILLHEGVYYLYGTTADHGIKVFSSTDLVNWTDGGMALKSEDSWGERWFWAPEVILREGIFYMYYSVEERLAVATSSSPLGPFVQEKKEPFNLHMPEIDSHVFLDDDGTYYFYFVRFDNGNHIWGAVLNDDMASIDTTTLVRLLSPTVPWERTMFPVNEGPFMLKHEGLYYLTYSGDHFESPGYGVGYAISDNPLGPFEKHKNNPILQSNAQVNGAGHHSFVQSPDGAELFMVYHNHNSVGRVQPRRTSIDRAKFVPVEGGPPELLVYGPTITAQPMP